MLAKLEIVLLTIKVYKTLLRHSVPALADCEVLGRSLSSAFSDSLRTFCKPVWLWKSGDRLKLSLDWTTHGIFVRGLE